MYTIKTLNAISPVGLAKLNNKQFDVAVDTDAPDGILVRSADMLNTAFNDNLLAIARAGAGGDAAHDGDDVFHGAAYLDAGHVLRQVDAEGRG